MHRAAVVALLALAFAPFGRADDATMLIGSVGKNDAFKIDLTDATGKHVRWLPPGTYTILVHDYSAIHNFRLASNTDMTVDFKTGVEFVGDMTFSVTFKDLNVYAYACEPHPFTMFGSFTVTSTPPSPPPPPPPPPPPLRKLTAIVSASGAVSLSAVSVSSGRFAISVSDRSKTAGFHLVGPGVSAKTGAAFLGNQTWRLTLRRGTYAYFSDTAPSRRKTLAVR
jgi:plastocyanin